MIYCADPRAQYLRNRDEIDAAIQQVLTGGRYILGQEVTSFEEEFAEYLNVGYAVGCGNGTDALVLALKALDIGDGDEVIVPSHTAVPTVAAVVMAGAVPVYVDIEADYFTLQAAQVDAACTSKTKAIICVHLYGQAAALDDLAAIARRRGLYLIEDCAQSTGASWQDRKLGSIGDLGCFSFFPTKNLGAIGDGGAVVCNDESLARRLQKLRQYGWDQDRVSQEPGLNSRLDELQAAILRVKLRHLDADNEARRSQAATYDRALADLPLILPAVRDAARHVYHLYVALAEDRDRLIACLQEADILAGIHYPVPAHRMKAYRSEVSLPVTDRTAEKVVSLPVYPGLDSEHQLRIIDALHTCFNSSSIR